MHQFFWVHRNWCIEFSKVFYNKLCEGRIGPEDSKPMLTEFGIRRYAYDLQVNSAELMQFSTFYSKFFGLGSEFPE